MGKRTRERTVSLAGKAGSWEKTLQLVSIIAIKAIDWYGKYQWWW